MSVHSAPMSRIPKPRSIRKMEEYDRTESAPAPSKLEMMKAQYQRKIGHEKEEKLIDMYERNQNQAMKRVMGSLNIGDRPGLVREFFKERREMERTELAGTPREYLYQDIKLHYSKKRAEYGKPPIHVKKSAGRDKASPLAPLTAKSPVAPNKPLTTFPTKAPLPPSQKTINNNIRRTYDSDSDNVDNAPKTFIPTNVGRTQKKKHRAEYATKQENGKLTAFQQWQIEQNQAREERLKKNGYQPEPQESSPSDYAGSNSPKTKASNTPREVKVKREKHKILAKQRQKPMQFSDNEDEEYSSESGLDVETRKREEELLAMIQRQQAELARLQQERVVEEEKERKEAELLRREAERQRKQKEKLRKQQEMEAARAEQEQAEMEANQNNINTFKSSQPPENGRITPPRKPQRIKAVTPSRKKRNIVPEDNQSNEDGEDRIETSGADAYVKLVSNLNQTIEGVDSLNLAECSTCGRKFAADRLEKHSIVCQKNSQKKRKVFDPVKMRVEGTEHAQYVQIHKKKQGYEAKPKAPPEKKSNWKTQHQNFIEAIRYAKKVSEIEKQGGNLADLPPPPKTENPDYTECPHCGRKFNVSAAERHIPRCQNLKTKPITTKRR